MLLNAEGEDKQRFWARAPPPFIGDRTGASALDVAFVEGLSTLHRAAGHGADRSTRLLLAAGADETVTCPIGQRPSDVIGISMLPGLKDPRKKCQAVARAFKQVPAFRSRSWTWPAKVSCGEGGAGGDRVSGDDAAVLPSPDLANRASLGVRVFRPRSNNAVWCVRLFPR